MTQLVQHRQSDFLAHLLIGFADGFDVFLVKHDTVRSGFDKHALIRLRDTDEFAAARVRKAEREPAAAPRLRLLRRLSA